MQLIEALKLRSKLFFLFILITLGLISVAIMANMHVESMKTNIDKVYFGSLVPVVELNEILQIYNNNLQKSIYHAAKLEISPSQVSSEIASGLKQIKDRWHSYESHYKRDDEKSYLSYVSLEIERTNAYFLQVHKVAQSGANLSKINMKKLEKKISFINGVIQKLIVYEVEVAHYERKLFLQNYSQSKIHIIMILTLITGLLLSISWYVFRSIQKDQTALEVTTKKLKLANKKLENVSYTDVLTGLHNRRYFNYIYEKELKRARRGKNYITFMMLDIDYFKQYNDTYGHIEGDYTLKSVANVLQATLKRPSDYVFRLGGEEFGVLLTETNETNSAKLAGDICDAVRDREIKHETSSVNEFVTISIGVVCCVADEALDEGILVSRADEMLYEAKENGRNKYVITSNVSFATPKIIQESE